ncbi:unnamed protein product [Sphagnum jensenii]|uniref:Uncharacterized protein n=1 Tax=Sphagnum jensenii TaxID=128206 RepID=A0ABP0WXN8_9BRYO
MLHTLGLNQNSPNGSILEIFANLTELVSLDLLQNQRTDIGNLRSLSQMDVSHNQGSGAIPQSRTHLTNLSILDLRQNSSSGVIPPSMANLQALTELVLFENHFTGIVPGNSGKDYNLTRFEASTNLLSGAVPVHVREG